jgi:hypothetical protein
MIHNCRSVEVRREDCARDRWQRLLCASYGADRLAHAILASAAAAGEVLWRWSCGKTLYITRKGFRLHLAEEEAYPCLMLTTDDESSRGLVLTSWCY